MRKIGIGFFGLALILVATLGCDRIKTVDVKAAAAKVLDAETAMEQGKPQDAYSLYQQAVELDPANTKANFHLGLLSAVTAVEDADTNKMVALYHGKALPTKLDQILLVGTSAATTSATSTTDFEPTHERAIRLTAHISTEAKVVEQIQSYLKKVILPRLDAGLAALANVESNADFSFTLKKSITRASKDYEIDLTEVYSVDALLSYLKTLLHEFVAYKWEFDYSKSPLEDANFGILASDGKEQMEKSRLAYVRFYDRIIKGIAYWDAETDDQSDDIAPQNKTASTNESKTKLVDYATKIKQSIEGTSTTFAVTIKKKDKNLAVVYGKYYTDPVPDWKLYISKDWLNLKRALQASDFAGSYDFTLRGVFPELTSFEKWKDFVN